MLKEERYIFIRIFDKRSYDSEDIKRTFLLSVFISSHIAATHMLAYAHKEELSDSKCDQQAIPGSFSLNCLDGTMVLS